MWSIALRVLIAGTASLVFAAPAAADNADYLHALQDTYQSLSAEQLLSEGMKICRASRSGMTSPQIVAMVQRDLGESVSAGLDIVSEAIVRLDC
jgi:hypothetical protein